jgi:RHS repeat-associated protein
MQYVRTNNGATGTFTVDNKNQLTSAPSPVNSQTYDDNGNLITSANGRYEYAYDDENRLVQRLDNGSGVFHPPTLSQFVYDGLGRLRVRQEFTWVCQQPDSPAPGGPSVADTELQDCSWVLDSETHYIYDGMRVIQERNGDNFPTVSYTRGNDLSGTLEGAGGIGGLLARSSGYSIGNWTSHAFYHADGNGNITYLVDSSQALAASYRYDPFGNLISSSGGLATLNVYRFSSKEIHVNSGMYYYLYRFYDPNLQRWINRDPLGEPGFELLRRGGPEAFGDGPNLYHFVKNNPEARIDAIGLSVSTRACTQTERKKCDKICAKKGKTAFRCTIEKVRVKLPGCPGLWTPGWVEVDFMDCECAKIS